MHLGWVNRKLASWPSLRLGVGYVFVTFLRENSPADTSTVFPQHCRDLAPEYEKTAKSFNSLVPLYAVDCDAEANKPLCGQQVGGLWGLSLGLKRC